MLMLLSLLACSNDSPPAGEGAAEGGSGNVSEFFFQTRQGNAAWVDDYLEAHPDDVNVVLGGETPLWCAIRQMTASEDDPQLEVIRVLLEHGANMYQRAPSSGHPFGEVAGRQSIEGIKLFLDNGYEINFLDSQGRHVALGGASNSEVAELILENGADPNFVDGDRVVTPLYAAVRNAVRSSRSYHTLVQNTPEDLPGYEDILTYDRVFVEDAYRTLELLLDAGADPTTPSINGETPGELAVRESEHLPEELVARMRPGSRE